MNRAFNLCSTKGSLQHELTTVKTIFKEGGYPSHMIHRAIQDADFKRKYRVEQVKGEPTKGEMPRWAVTYYPDIHHELKRKLRGLGVEVVAANYNNIKKCLVQVKDKIPILERKGVVYGLECKQCEASYTGQSGQCLKTRLYRHKLAERNNDIHHYPLVEHCVNEGHNIDWSKVTIHTVEQNQTKRCLLESLFIAKDGNAVNKQPGLLHSSIWEWTLEGCSLPLKKLNISVLGILVKCCGGRGPLNKY